MKQENLDLCKREVRRVGRSTDLIVAFSDEGRNQAKKRQGEIRSWRQSESDFSTCLLALYPRKRPIRVSCVDDITSAVNTMR